MMGFEVVEPQKGFTITEEEAKLIKLGYATSINVVRFPYQKDIPEFFKSVPVN